MLTVKDIKPGALDQRIVLQTATAAATEYGNLAETWATLATVWASVEDVLSGSDETQEGKIHQAAQRTAFTIRYRADVNERTRISYTPPSGSAETYDILFMERLGRSGYLRINAEKRKP